MRKNEQFILNRTSEKKMKKEQFILDRPSGLW